MLRPATPTIMPVPLSGPKPLGTLTLPLSSLTPLAASCPTCTFTDEMAKMLLQQLGFELNKDYTIFDDYKLTLDRAFVVYQLNLELKLQVTPAGSDLPLLITQPGGKYMSWLNLECANDDWMCKFSSPYYNYEYGGMQDQHYSYIGQDFSKGIWPFPNLGGGGQQLTLGGNLYNTTLGCEYRVDLDYRTWETLETVLTLMGVNTLGQHLYPRQPVPAVR